MAIDGVPSDLPNHPINRKPNQALVLPDSLGCVVSKVPVYLDGQQRLVELRHHGQHILQDSDLRTSIPLPQSPRELELDPIKGLALADKFSQFGDTYIERDHFIPGCLSHDSVRG